MRNTRAMTVLLLICSFACQGDKDDVPETDASPPHPEYHVKMWVDPASGLPVGEMLGGCNLWNPAEVGCELVDTEEESDVQVYADTDPCTPDSNGSIVLAYAYCCGPIVFIRECYRDDDGNLDLEALQIVSSHEVGHQLGLWWHVPDNCNGNDARTHPDGELVCGDAVMNAYFDRNVAMPIHPDFLAFDMRDKPHSVVDEYNHHADDELGDGSQTCVYRSQKPLHQQP